MERPLEDARSSSLASGDGPTALPPGDDAAPARPDVESPYMQHPEPLLDEALRHFEAPLSTLTENATLVSVHLEAPLANLPSELLQPSGRSTR